MYGSKNRGHRQALLFLSLLSGIGPASAQEPGAQGPLAHLTFEDNQEHWVAYGNGAQVGITREPGNVKEGQAALQYNYQLQQGVLSGMVMPVPVGTLTNLKAIRFAIKTDGTAPVIVVLQEQSGGRYIALFTVQGSDWQPIELAPADFALSHDANAPDDSNKVLDLDKVEAIAIGDFNQIPAQSDNETIRSLFPLRLGAHTLFIDDFLLSAEPLAAPKTVEGEVALDNRERPQLMWVALGAAKVTRNTNREGSLQLDYKRNDGRIQGLMRQVGGSTFKDMKSVAFTVTSTLRTTLAVQVEETDGGKYYAPVEVPEGGVAQEVQVSLADFKPANDSNDANGHLDAENVRQIAILDASGLLQLGQGKDNTLQIDNIRASKAP